MFRAWLKTVENRPEGWENSPVLSTASTAGLLNILRAPGFVLTFSLPFSQARTIFTQLPDIKFPLFGWFSYTLSTAPTAANRFLN